MFGEHHVSTLATDAAYSDSKRHYPILDGLRGVAALMVVAFHLFEAHAPNRFEQLINHGYLAVDFFFVLSGFVIGYAYDDRWRRMSFKDFCKRRLVRLHPMIVVAMLIGALMFPFQASGVFPKYAGTSLGDVLLALVVGATLLPLPPSMDVRGWGEMHSLNGPAWSLFFEYVANLLYALVIRRFSNTALAILVFVAGCALAQHTVWGPNGDVIGGWSLEPVQLRLGFTRLMYPFFAGLLLSRMVRPSRVAHAFPVCALLVAAILAMPRVGGPSTLWMNGVYEAFCIVVLFPLIVWLGASGTVAAGAPARACGFLGAISYPLYIVHYPFVYTYTAWVANGKVKLADGWPVVLAAFGASVALAWLCLTYYDVPLRRWLGRRFVEARADTHPPHAAATAVAEPAPAPKR